MAKKDVIKYFYQVQNEYMEMVDCLKDVQIAQKDGKVDREQLSQLQQEVSKIKINYERLAFIVMLLNLPQKSSKKEKAKKAQGKLYQYFDDVLATDAAVINECEDVLKELKKHIKQKG